jgi:hypothetical protein
VLGDRHNASIREHRLCKNKHDWIETYVEIVLVMRYASLAHPTRSAIALENQAVTIVTTFSHSCSLVSIPLRGRRWELGKFKYPASHGVGVPLSLGEKSET